jgi:hypothetical protein
MWGAKLAAHQLAAAGSEAVQDWAASVALVRKSSLGGAMRCCVAPGRVHLLGALAADCETVIVQHELRHGAALDGAAGKPCCLWQARATPAEEHGL